MKKARDSYNAIIQTNLPWVVLGENEVPGSLFFFFSLSNRDVNSSSELADSSSLEGAERVRLGEASEVGVLWGGRGKGEEKGDGELFASSLSGVLLVPVFVWGLE